MIQRNRSLPSSLTIPLLCTALLSTPVADALAQAPRLRPKISILKPSPLDAGKEQAPRRMFLKLDGKSSGTLILETPKRASLPKQKMPKPKEPSGDFPGEFPEAADVEFPPAPSSPDVAIELDNESLVLEPGVLSSIQQEINQKFGDAAPATQEFQIMGARPSPNATLVTLPTPSFKPTQLVAAEVSVDLEGLALLNKEIAAISKRSVPQFSSTTREVVGEREIQGIDLDALLRNEVIELPLIQDLAPLEILGASPVDIDPQRSLLITAIPVLEDRNRAQDPCARPGAVAAVDKPWSFAHLMTELSRGSSMTPGEFAQDWLGHWVEEQMIFSSDGTFVDSLAADGRDGIVARILNPWRERSGGGELDLNLAPFRLQAILYRPDLATLSEDDVYGAPTEANAGELRFVFGFMEVRDMNGDGDANDREDACQIIEAAVIFEYKVPSDGCSDTKAWANQWVELSDMRPGTPEYQESLEELTERVVRFDPLTMAQSRSNLGQLRTNEIDFSGLWQFREFEHSKRDGTLAQTTVKNNPREHQFSFGTTDDTPFPPDLNQEDAFLAEIRNNLATILAGDYIVPEFTPDGEPYIGGSSSYNIDTAWDHVELSTDDELEARFKVSLNTCSGCHTGETGTRFYHIAPNGRGRRPDLSPFLLNNPHRITDVRGIEREFREMDHREQELSSLANLVCSTNEGLAQGMPFFQTQLIHRRLKSFH